MADKSPELEKFYADRMQSVINGIIAKYDSYLVSSSKFDTGGMYGEPWKRHITLIFKSAQVHAQVKSQGIWTQIETNIRAAVDKVNAGMGDAKPLDVYAVNSVDIDAINAAGGYYNYFH